MNTTQKKSPEAVAPRRGSVQGRGEGPEPEGIVVPADATRITHTGRNRNKAVNVPKLRTREVVARDRFPNFRDHGRMVDRPLLDVLASLQKRYGEAFASEAGLRRMICQDTGHMPGVDTIPTALERLEAQGLVAQRWLKPGGILPGGGPCTYGTRLVFLPQCRRDRRGLQARAGRRDGVTYRGDRRKLHTLEQAKRSIAQQFRAPPPAPATDIEDKRRRDLERLAALQASWTDKPDPEREPG